MAINISLPSVGVAAFVVAVLLYACYRAALPRPIPGIPYNKKSAQRILGDAPDLFKYKAEHGDTFTILADMAVKMQEPVFQIFMQPLSRPWVVVMDPRETHDIMTRRTKEFDRSNFFGQIFSAMLPKFHAHFPTGNEWHAHRRLISDTMAPPFLNKVAGPQMWNSMSSMVDMWKEKARLAQGRPFSAKMDVHNTTLDIIWAATFGGSMGPNKIREELLAKIDKLDLDSNLDKPVDFPEPRDSASFKSIITLVTSMSIPVNSMMPTLAHWFALNTDRSLIDARRKKDELIRGRLKEAREKISQKETKDVESTAGMKSALDLVISKEIKMADKEGRTANFDSQAIQDELFGFLIAGEDTTSTTFEWAIKFLTADQEAQKKLRDTLRNGFKRAAQSNETPTVEEITATTIPYLDAVVEECPRLGITVPGSARKALRDTEVLGYHIPAGTDVFMMNNGPGYVMDTVSVDEHKRSKNSQANKDKIPAWTDPSKFNPERWLDQEGSFNPHAGPFNVFGAGPRACFGRKWAHLELRIMLIFVIWNFELLPTPAALSDFSSFDGMTHGPQKCYARLRALS